MAGSRLSLMEERDSLTDRRLDRFEKIDLASFSVSRCDT